MTFFEKFLFKFPFSHKRFPNVAKDVSLSILQAVSEVFNKSHFSLQMGNYPIPVAEHSGLGLPRGTEKQHLLDVGIFPCFYDEALIENLF